MKTIRSVRDPLYRIGSWIINIVHRFTSHNLPGTKVEANIIKLQKHLDEIYSHGIKKYFRSSKNPKLLRNELHLIAGLSDKNQINSKRVLALTYSFFDLNGKNFMFGGGERYLIELNKILAELGYELEIYQLANFPWASFYEGIKVVGIPTGYNINALNRRFHDWIPAGALTIYSPYTLAFPKHHNPSIGISHGIYWDFQTYYKNWETLKETITLTVSPLKNINHLVSVDTNTFNWLRTVTSYKDEKRTYIPNFVDTTNFRPVINQKNPNEYVILYPRRLYKARGFWLVSTIIPRALEEFPSLRFLFVGQADPKEKDEINRLIGLYPANIEWKTTPPEEMNLVYQQADITLIPTVHSEGTSLSCLEALACGNAVIATNVGGLPDLIIDHYNGLLINPDSDELWVALKELITHPDLLKKLSKNGRNSAQTFDLCAWRNKWRVLLKDTLPMLSTHKRYQPHRIVLFPKTPGIDWLGIRQRPQAIANQFASNDIPTIWMNSTQTGRSYQENLQVFGVSDSIFVSDPILFIYYPYHYELLNSYKNPFVIYDVLDDISIHDRSDEENAIPIEKRARYYHQKMLERADLVLTSSITLRNQLTTIRPDTLYIPNGVDVNLFHPRRIAKSNKSINRLKHPIIGFHGAIAEWFDVSLFINIARKRPDLTFALIGPCIDKTLLTDMLKLANVHYYPPVPQEYIPSWISEFDAEFVPFKINQLTLGVRPLKILEALAMGKPVISTGLPSVVDWPGIFIGNDIDSISFELDRALSVPKSELEKKLIEFASGESWEITTRPLIDRIHKLMKETTDDREE